MLIIVFSTLILIGCLIGSIKIKNISLDISGVLLLSIVWGIVTRIAESLAPTSNFSKNMFDLMQSAKTLSPFGTAIFIAAIGLTAGYSIVSQSKQYFKYSLIGWAITILNFVIMCLVKEADHKIESSLLYGSFCGAMTSTPGLTAFMDKSKNELASAGYGGAYIFGVSATILFVQLIARKVSDNTGVSKESEAIHDWEIAKKARFGGLFQIALTIIIGSVSNLLADKVFRGIGFGNTCWILLSGVVIGHFVRRHNINRITQSEMNVYRNLGLCFFFVS